MNRHCHQAVMLLCATAIATPVWVGAEPVHRAHDHRIPNQYIVVFSGTGATANYFTGLSEVDVEAKAGELAAKHHASVGRTWRHALNGMVAQMTPAQAAALAKNPDVALVEEDAIVSINTTQAGVTWGLDRIDQQSLPLNTLYQYNVNGSGVTAYIIDTGILTTHAEFGGRASGGFTAVADGNGTNDCNGHGTHVAGTVGGGTYGVAKGVNLVAVRVLDCSGSGSVSGVIAGIDWVTQHKLPPAVANMSLGGGASSALDAAVQNSIAAGVTYAIAAGNSAANACNSSPADVPEAITVGATDSTDSKPSWSNYGSCLDLFAPGVNITSSWNSSSSATNTISGTSMATPHVTGAAALYLSSLPGATPAQVAAALTSNATLNKVVNPGSGSVNKLLYTGFIAPAPVDTVPPTAGLTAPTAGQTLVGNVNLKADATDNVAVAKVDFLANTTLLGTVTTPPYQLTWNSASLLNGTYSFYAKATDTSGLTTTSTAVSATIANPVTPPACLTSSQLIVNPGFESGSANWTSSSGVITNSSSYPAHSGVGKAKLNGYGYARTDTLYQQVNVPVNACSANLSFWLNITTREGATTSAYDTLTVTVRSTAGTLLGTLATYSNVDKSTGYVQKTLNLLPFKGKTVRLQFQGVEDYSLATWFLVDDVNLNVTQ